MSEKRALRGINRKNIGPVLGIGLSAVALGLLPACTPQLPTMQDFPKIPTGISLPSLPSVSFPSLPQWPTAEPTQTPTPTATSLLSQSESFFLSDINPGTFQIPRQEGYTGSTIPGTLTLSFPPNMRLEGPIAWLVNPRTPNSIDTPEIGIATLKGEKGKPDEKVFVFVEAHGLRVNPRNQALMEPDPNHVVVVWEAANGIQAPMDKQTLQTLQDSHFANNTLHIATSASTDELKGIAQYVQVDIDTNGQAVMHIPGGPLGTDLQIPIRPDQLKSLIPFNGQITPFAQVRQTVETGSATQTPTYTLTPEATATLKRIQQTVAPKKTNTALHTVTPQPTFPEQVKNKDGSLWKYDKRTGTYTNIATPKPQPTHSTTPAVSPSPVVSPTPSPTATIPLSVFTGHSGGSTEPRDFTSSPEFTLLGASALIIAVALLAGEGTSLLIDIREKQKKAKAAQSSTALIPVTTSPVYQSKVEVIPLDVDGQPLPTVANPKIIDLQEERKKRRRDQDSE